MLITSKVLSVTGLSSKHPTQYAAALGMTKRHRKLSTREVEHLSPTPFPALFSSYEGVSLCTCFSPSCGSFLTPVAFTSSLIASLSLGCPGGFPCSSLLRCCWWSWGTGKLLCQDPAVKKNSLPSLKLLCGCRFALNFLPLLCLLLCSMWHMLFLSPGMLFSHMATRTPPPSHLFQMSPLPRPPDCFFPFSVFFFCFIFPIRMYHPLTWDVNCLWNLIFTTRTQNSVYKGFSGKICWMDEKMKCSFHHSQCLCSLITEMESCS